MYLRKSVTKETGRIYLSIAHGYRDSDGLSKSRTIQKIGYLDDLMKIHDDPITHYTKIAKEMDKQRLETKSMDVTLDLTERLDNKSAPRKNFGHVIFSKVYHELEIDRFMNNMRRHTKFEYNTEAMMRLFVFSRLLYPDSKRGTLLNKDSFFDAFDFSLDDVYNALDHFNEISPDLQRHLHKQVTDQYKRETNLVYYDVTNYYFETDKEDALRKRGAAKQNRKKPIVQLGLFMDKNSLPIMYKQFPGNTHDSQTLLPMLTEIKKTYGVKRLISVADKALNTGDNIAYHTILGDGYIYSKSIRGASDEFKAWVLSQEGYRVFPDGRKIKSKVVPDAPINITVGVSTKSKRKKKAIETVEQKWIVSYDEKYSARAKHKRDELIEKAQKMIANPVKYQKAIDYGAAGYISNIKINKETGLIENTKDTLFLDYEKITEEEKYDGYYAIVTSELDEPDDQILQIYKGLWRIEESFKITKLVLNTRPIYVRLEKHINAHFLICFVSLLISRIVEMRIGREYTIERIIESLRKVACSNVYQNIWTFDYTDEVTDALSKAFGIDFNRKFLTLSEIKNILASTKKTK